MSDEIGSREFWRLGHRRPWWQWNVLTLFAGLFLLVWARELFRLPQTATWIICVIIFAAWFMVPTILLADVRKADSGDELTESHAATPDGIRPVYLLASLAMFGAVVWAGGFVAGVLSVLAAMLYASATRNQRE